MTPALALFAVAAGLLCAALWLWLSHRDDLARSARDLSYLAGGFAMLAVANAIQG